MGLFKTLVLMLISTSLLAEDKPPKDWRISASLGNSVGIGSFVAGYANQPSWSTSLSLSPSYQFKPFTISAFQNINFWWLDSYKTSISDVDNRVSFSDLNLNIGIAKVVDIESVGFSLSADLLLMFPVSLLSRRINRVVSLGIDIPLRFSRWGFNAGWTPSISGWLYSDSVISAPCFEMAPSIINPQNIHADLSQVMQGMVITRNSEDRLGGGRCIVSGRQTVLSLSNMFSAGWSHSNHSLSLGFGWFLNFLRPLANRPDLKSNYASSQNFTESTLGRIAYSYTIPIETDLSVSAGVMSIQASRTKSGDLAFPFFDFVTPGNNQTQVFIQATVGI